MIDNEKPADDAGDEELDALLDDGVQNAREWFRQQVRTRGLRVAFTALVAVCEDPKAPAPAKATAGTALLRAGGAFSKAEEEALDDKPIETMSVSEMERQLKRLQSRRRALSRPSRSSDKSGEDNDDEGGVFE